MVHLQKAAPFRNQIKENYSVALSLHFAETDVGLKMIYFSPAFSSGPDLSPGVSSISSQLHVQSHQNTQDQHYWHS